jgi:glutaredoxin
VLELYTLPVCPTCADAKAMLDRYNVPYKTYVIGDDITRESVLKMYPNQTVAPIIVKDGQTMSWQELVHWIAVTDFSKELK